MALTAQERASKIKVIIFDVDGVFTDGTIWLVPGRPADGGLLGKIKSNDSKDTSLGVQSDILMEVKGYGAHDGMGISLARLGGRGAFAVIAAAGLLGAGLFPLLRRSGTGRARADEEAEPAGTLRGERPEQAL